MSHMPQIIENIAKSLLGSTGDNEDYSSNKMDEASCVGQSGLKEKVDMKEESLPGLKIVEQGLNDDQEGGWNMENHFIKRQSRKLRILYPHFVGEEIQRCAKKIWRQLPDFEKNLFSQELKRGQSFDFEECKLKKQIKIRAQGNSSQSNDRLLNQKTYFDIISDNLTSLGQSNADQFQRLPNANQNPSERSLSNDLSTQIPANIDAIQPSDEKSQNFIFVSAQGEKIEQYNNRKEMGQVPAENQQIQEQNKVEQIESSLLKDRQQGEKSQQNRGCEIIGVEND